MNDSILDSIKKMLGILPEITDWDVDVISHINFAFSVLEQLGTNKKNSSYFAITDASTKWSDYTDDQYSLPLIKEYVFNRVRLLFDPPTRSGSAAMDAINHVIQELEWRISFDK